MYSTQEVPLSIKTILNYGSGEVAKYSKNFENKQISEQLKALHIYYVPDEHTWPNPESRKDYIHLRDNTLAYLKKIIEFRARHRRFYSQYKHGLKLPLREFGDESQIDLNGAEVPIYSYESLPITNKQFAGIEYNSFIQPNLHPDITLVVSELYERGELLRCDMAVVSFDDVLEIAYTTYQLFGCLCCNLIAVAGSNEDDATREVWFPSDNKDAPFVIVDYLYSDTETKNP